MKKLLATALLVAAMPVCHAQNPTQVQAFAAMNAKQPLPGLPTSQLDRVCTESCAGL